MGSSAAVPSCTAVQQQLQDNNNSGATIPAVALLPSADSKAQQQPAPLPGQEPSGVPHGVVTLQNSRATLEDAFSAHHLTPEGALALARSSSPAACSKTTVAGSEPLSFFGVYDGHGGPEVAHHAAATLHEHFQAAWAEQLSTAAALAGVGGSACSTSSSSSSAVLEGLLCDAWPSDSSADGLSSDCGGSSDGRLAAADAAGHLLDAPLPLELLSAASLTRDSPCEDAAGADGTSTSSSSDSPVGLRRRLSAPHHRRHPGRHSQRVITALREAFLRTDGELAGTEVGEVVGTTAVVAVVGQREMFVAHCGDSRAVLCRSGVAIPLTHDHKPSRSDELARVSSLGGRVVHKGGAHRVMGLLAMSRALGDHLLRPYVIPEPEVLCLERSPAEDELLILATDGLWDVFSCQEAATLALRSTIRARARGVSPDAACRVGAAVLVRGAVERGSRDNVTVALIDLRGRDCASISSVASLLVSQCSGLPYVTTTCEPPAPAPCAPAAGPGCSQQQQLASLASRKRRSGSQCQQPQQGGSSGCGAAAPAAAAGTVLNRRHTSSNGEGGSSSSLGGCDGATGCGSSTSSSGGRASGSGGSNWVWGWGLQGPQLRQQQQEEPGSRIIGLARAAATAMAALGSGGAQTAAMAALPSHAAPPAPARFGDLLPSMQSAPVPRRASLSGHNEAAVDGSGPGSSKPPLPWTKA